MKNILTLILSFLITISINLQAQNERYIDEIFTDVIVETGIQYAINWSLYKDVIGVPAMDTLVFDLYTPDGDMRTDRPVVILWTGGDFIPNSFNTTTLGYQNDYANVEIARRLAKRGYVALIPTYRKGWSPLGNFDERTGGLLNAIYRGVQDSRAVVRFLRKSIEEEGNSYGICPNKMVQWGIGTGAFISANSTTLDSYEDLLLDKFMGTSGGEAYPYVDITINSDPSGSTETELNHVNHGVYDDDVSLCVNMGGFIADSSFLDTSDPPMICFATPAGDNVPYNTDLYFPYPVMAGFFFEVTGPYDIITRAQELGVNDVFSTVAGDPYSLAAAYTASHPNYFDVTVSGPEGLNGFMPFNRPTWESPINQALHPENAPWDYWDIDYWSTIPHPVCPPGSPIEDCNYHFINGLDNQDMSLEKSNIYLDSVMGYVLPRAYLALNLSNINCTTGTEDLLEQQSISFDVFPNPVISTLKIKTDLTILEAYLYNLQGEKIAGFNNVNAKELQIDRKKTPTGIYLIKIKTREGIATKKVVFN